jgi:hypothetical protein
MIFRLKQAFCVLRGFHKARGGAAHSCGGSEPGPRARTSVLKGKAKGKNHESLGD